MGPWLSRVLYKMVGRLYGLQSERVAFVISLFLVCHFSEAINRIAMME